MPFAAPAGSGGSAGTRGRGAKLTVNTNNQSARPIERLAPAKRGGGGGGLAVVQGWLRGSRWRQAGRGEGGPGGIQRSGMEGGVGRTAGGGQRDFAGGGSRVEDRMGTQSKGTSAGWWGPECCGVLRTECGGKGVPQQGGDGGRASPGHPECGYRGAGRCVERNTHAGAGLPAHAPLPQGSHRCAAALEALPRLEVNVWALLG